MKEFEWLALFCYKAICVIGVLAVFHLWLLDSRPDAFATNRNRILGAVFYLILFAWKH